MKAASVWSASLVLVGAWVSACGEEPTSALTGVMPAESHPQVLMSTRQALTCSPDTDAPVLTLNSPSSIYYECTGATIGNIWTNPGASAVDACEGPLPVYQYNTGDDDGDGIPGTTDPDDFGPGPDTTTEGLYYVQYLAWDSSYNIQGEILDVYVQDTLKPVLTLNGSDSVQTQCFRPTDDPTDPDSDVEVDPDPYTDAGATAADQCYGDLTSGVLLSGAINKQSPGVYTLQYDVRDRAFNWADPITRSVEVIDTLNPKLQPLPSIQLSPVNGAMKTVELSECAVAWDLCDGYLDIDTRAYDLTVTSNDPGNDTADIAILSNSTFEVRARHNANSSARVYTAQYKVDDSSGNVIQGTCTITVP